MTERETADQCPMACPHGDRCTRRIGHDGGCNHRKCDCNEPNEDIRATCPGCDGAGGGGEGPDVWECPRSEGSGKARDPGDRYDPAPLTIAQRLMSHPRCPGWQPGMRPHIPGRPRSAWRLYRVTNGSGSWLAATGDGDAGGFVGSWVSYEEASRQYSAYEPDLTDPATAGWLLGWLEAAGVDVSVRYGRTAGRRVWEVLIIRGGESWDSAAPTLGEAAALALLALWGEP